MWTFILIAGVNAGGAWENIVSMFIQESRSGLLTHITLNQPSRDPDHYYKLSAATQIFTSEGIPIYQLEEQISINYTLTNVDEEAKHICTENTPFDANLNTNFFAPESELFWMARITEEAGCTEILLPPRKSISVELDLKNLVGFATQQGVGNETFSVSMQMEVDYCTSDRTHSPAAEELVMATRVCPTDWKTVTINTVDIPLSATVLIIDKDMEHLVEEIEIANRALEEEMLEMEEGEIVFDAQGSPKWQPGCVDHPEYAPYRRADGSVLPCAIFCSGTYAEYAPLCPKTCENGNNCPIHRSEYVFANTNKARTFSTSCTGEHQGKSEEDAQIMNDICSDVIETYQNDKEFFGTIAKKWFGINDDSNLEQIYTRIVKMCSLNKYNFRCDPKNEDPNYWIPNNFDTCATESMVVGYVYGQDVVERNIQLCPYHFTFNSRARVETILHELTHFVDQIATQDLTYGVTEMLDMASNNPGEPLKNAASWHSFFGDESWPKHVWTPDGQVSNSNLETSSSTETTESHDVQTSASNSDTSSSTKSTESPSTQTTEKTTSTSATVSTTTTITSTAKPSTENSSTSPPEKSPTTISSINTSDLSAIDCDACVSLFMIAGGCECLAYDSCIQDNLIPEGCDPCGEQAALSCGITDDEDACPKEENRGECERCMFSSQCEGDSYCCPYMKKCVSTSSTSCYTPIGYCDESSCDENQSGYPESCSCSNPDWPHSWVNCSYTNKSFSAMNTEEENAEHEL